LANSIRFAAKLAAQASASATKAALPSFRRCNASAGVTVNTASSANAVAGSMTAAAKANLNKERRSIAADKHSKHIKVSLVAERMRQTTATKVNTLYAPPKIIRPSYPLYGRF
jgi:NADP-dependent 3-hydroxy acid dehydrogenase YdfG